MSGVIWYQLGNRTKAEYCARLNNSNIGEAIDFSYLLTQCGLVEIGVSNEQLITDKQERNEDGLYSSLRSSLKVFARKSDTERACLVIPSPSSSAIDGENVSNYAYDLAKQRIPQIFGSGWYLTNIGLYLRTI